MEKVENIAAENEKKDYAADKKTLYLNTDILLDSLQDSLQAEIIQGKYVENEEDLYNFLESYSS